MAIPLAILIPHLQQDDFHYDFGKGALVISGFSPPPKFTNDFLNNRFEFAGQGNPAKVFINSSGIAITALNIAAKGQMSAQKTYFLTESQTSKNSKIVFDSSVAKPFHPKTEDKQTSRSEINTDSTDYAGDETQGKLTFPGPFDLVSHVSGSQSVEKDKKKVDQTYDQNLSLHGASAKLDVDPRPGVGFRAIKDGTCEGPVTFSGQRTETTEGVKAPSITTIKNGKCDRMTIHTDASGETLVLIGHVSFDLETESGPLHFANGQTFTFNLGPTLSLISVDGNGSPFRMTFPLKGQK